MTLSHVTREEAVKRLAQSQAGAPDSIEALCDLVRAEVHARKHAPRAATLSRVARLLAPAIALDEERLAEACDALERDKETWLDPYAAEAPAEFFAVISEAFFEAPNETRRRYPEVYEQLRRFYRQDPAARLAA